MRLLIWLGSLAVASSQTTADTVVTNLSTAKWTHEKGDPANSEGVMLDADPKSGGMDLLVRLPAGHVIPPHFHDSNERIVVVEGQLRLRRKDGEATIDTGGFAFLPARQVQRLSCSSGTRCSFYLMWDGKPDSHPSD